jgi:hypothetical protein
MWDCFTGRSNPAWRATSLMARSNAGAVFEQHARGFRLAPIHHPHQRRLPIVRPGLAREALSKWAFERRQVARHGLGPFRELAAP